MNKASDNYYAEMILRTLGMEKTGRERRRAALRR